MTALQLTLILVIHLSGVAIVSWAHDYRAEKRLEALRDVLEAARQPKDPAAGACDCGPPPGDVCVHDLSRR